MLGDRVACFIAQHQLIKPADRIAVGVSGGLDSVVLLHLLVSLGYAPLVIHINYKLRGEESEADEQLVLRLCASMRLPFEAATLDAKAFAKIHKKSIQASARILRYTFFHQIARRQGLQGVAVAHHRDDQIETVLLNLLRGSGVEGLAGMPVSRPIVSGADVRLVRPLLETPRSDLEAYAKANALQWREDSSNASLQYRRNVIRREILPVIAAHFGNGAVRNIAQAANLTREYVSTSLRTQLRIHMKACSRAIGEKSGGLDIAYLDSLPAVWRNRVILEGLRRWIPEAEKSALVAERISALRFSQTGRLELVGPGIVFRERTEIVFQNRPLTNISRGAAAVVGPDEQIDIESGIITVELLPYAPDALDAGTPLVAYMDAAMLSFPLLARPWQDGDRFRPLGMLHSKKVSDFLTDEKVPSRSRKRVFVLCSRDEIVWVVGRRIADTVRITESTGSIAKITYIPCVDP